MKKALVIIDMQNDFVDGVLASPADDHQLGGVEAVKNAANYINDNVRVNDLVYITKDTHYEDYMETQEGRNLPVPHCIKGTYGHQVHDYIYNAVRNAKDRMKAAGGSIDVKYMEKAAFGAVNVVNDLETQHVLKPLDSITLMGICTSICLTTTAALLKSSPTLRNVPVYIYKDGSSDVNGVMHLKALDVMESFQVKII